MCYLFFYRCLPQFCFPLPVFVVSTVLSFLLVLKLLSGPRSGACSVSDPGVLATFINQSINQSINELKLTIKILKY